MTIVKSLMSQHTTSSSSQTSLREESKSGKGEVDEETARRRMRLDKYGSASKSG